MPFLTQWAEFHEVKYCKHVVNALQNAGNRTCESLFQNYPGENTFPTPNFSRRSLAPRSLKKKSREKLSFRSNEVGLFIRYSNAII